MAIKKANEYRNNKAPSGRIKQTIEEQAKVLGIRRANASQNKITKADLPAGMPSSELDASKANRRTPTPGFEKDLQDVNRSQISSRANRVSGPSLPPPFSQHRGVEEVLMQARRGAKKTPMDDTTRHAIRSVLDHAAEHLEVAGGHHRNGDHAAAHTSLTVAVGSLNHAMRRLDSVAGGNGATAVHLSNNLQNHLNSYRDEHL